MRAVRLLPLYSPASVTEEENRYSPTGPHRWTGMETQLHKDMEPEGRTDRQLRGQMDGNTNGQLDKQMDRQTDRLYLANHLSHPIPQPRFLCLPLFTILPSPPSPLNALGERLDTSYCRHRIKLKRET